MSEQHLRRGTKRIQDGGIVVVDDEMAAAVAVVERLLNYTFRNVGLLEEALTHPSHTDHPSYQRLEHLGDAALCLAFTCFFFLTCPTLDPGHLSALRAANISTEKLARVAIRHNLYRLLRRNSPKMDQMVEQFTAAVRCEDSSAEPFGGVTQKAPKVLADIVESIASAVYVDCNFDLEKMWKVIRGLVEPIITSETLDEQPVTTLHEHCQKHGMDIEFKPSMKGNVNVMRVFINKQLFGTGCSEQKRIAKLNAARDALDNLSTLEVVDMECDDLVVPGVDKNGFKMKLHQMCLKKKWLQPVYKIEEEYGPPHSKRFCCSVHVGASTGTFITIGDTKSRLKDAENSAAEKILSEYRAILDSEAGDFK